MNSWDDFLHIRAKVIGEMLAEGDSPEQVARRLSMVRECSCGTLFLDGDQVRLIGMSSPSSQCSKPSP